MSERKSWDVQRKQATAPVQPPAPKKPALRTAPAVPSRKPVATSEPARQARKSAPLQNQRRTTAAQSAGTLRERRQKKRRAARYVWLTLLVFAFGGLLYALWLPAFRIQTVEASGPDAEASRSIAHITVAGTYGYVLPRNSIFFYPKAGIRSAILDASPDVSAVSLTRTSFSSIEVHTTPRAQSFMWCGTNIETPFTGGTCWNADIEGLIFSQSNDLASSTAPTDKQVRVYSPLDKEIADGQSPLRAHIASAARLPNALKFVAAVEGLGVPVQSLAIAGDEANVWISSATRIEYVIGHEQDAANLAASVLPGLKLPDPTIEYIDLRFSGKAYILHYGVRSQ